MLERNSRGSLKRMDDKMAVRNGLIVRLKKAKEFLEEEKDDATINFSLRLKDIEAIVDALYLENKLCVIWKDRHETYNN